MRVRVCEWRGSSGASSWLSLCRGSWNLTSAFPEAPRFQSRAGAFFLPPR